ncbi:MAG TPA: PASTA domain-containing protein, partial [Acidimicrobiales bacterium]|nr:PASTA domain-containing protein [Acidimicrobiales bacterium]
PPTVLIPDVLGMTVVQATDAIQSAGLQVSQVNGNPLGNVKSTDPPVGSSVDVGSSVTLVTR